MCFPFVNVIFNNAKVLFFHETTSHKMLILLSSCLKLVKCTEKSARTSIEVKYFSYICIGNKTAKRCFGNRENNRKQYLKLKLTHYESR